MSRIRRGVRAEIAKVLSLPRGIVVPDARLDDLGIAHVDRYELVVGLQIRFGVDCVEKPSLRLVMKALVGSA